MATKKLNAILVFDEADINVAIGMLQKAGALPDKIDAAIFTEGDTVELNLSEILKDDPTGSISTAVAFIAAMVPSRFPEHAEKKELEK